MSLPLPPSTESTPTGEPAGSATGPKIWTAGTLRYTRGGIVILFFWLIWNDFFLILMEAVKPALTGILMKDHGATNAQIALYLGTLSGILTMWINPVVSTWSDRTRTKIGRRRPFLLIATPPAAIFLAAIPWAPEIWAWLMGIPAFAALGISQTTGVIAGIGIIALCFSVFNAVIMAIFTYFFWDVVPLELLGRFNSIGRIVTMVKTFVWNYWIFGLAEKYMHWIYGCLAGAFIVIYLTSLLMVKEGEYPPPEPREKGHLFAPVRAYFSDCFGESRYVWIYAAATVFYMSQIPGLYKLFFTRDVLGLNLDTIGKMAAWPSIVMVILAYPLGALIDRYHSPVRLLIPTMFISAAVSLVCYFFLRDKWMLLYTNIMTAVIGFFWGNCFSVLNVTAFPREKLGQFSSANAMTHQTITMLLAWPVGMLFDYLNDYRYAYLWSAICQVLAGLIFIKVYLNFKRFHMLGSAVQVK